MGGKANTSAQGATGAAGALGTMAVVDTTAGAIEAAHREVGATDGARVEVVGSSPAAAAAAEALAAGGAGAGIGGQRIAEALDGPAIRDVPLAGADHIGDRTGTFGRAGTDAGGFDRAAALSDIARDEFRRSLYGSGVATAATRPGRNVILPLAEPKLDPRLVPGLKVATAAAQVLQGKGHAPGEPVVVDFRTHTELVSVGAITAVPWHDLPDHDTD